MKNFQKLLPVAAILISFSPLAAIASSYRPVSHVTVSHVSSTDSRLLAVNSRGRPGEFTPLKAQDADVTYFSAATPANKDGAPIPNGN